MREAAGRPDRQTDLRRVSIAILSATIACAALAGSTGSDAVGAHDAISRKGPKAKEKPRRPNIVVVMTDDQRADEVGFMPQLQAQVAAPGVSFSNSIVSYSFCCPSRATYFTGQYAHNHGVLTNEPPFGGYSRLAPTLRNTLPVWLHRVGYRTGLIGKFLNHYGTKRVPPGWDEWHATFDAGAYGYKMNDNGRISRHGSTPEVIVPAAYQTDVERRLAVRFIRRNARRRTPFFLNVATFAPHLEDPGTCGCDANNPRAAPRHEGRFAAQPLPKPPDYDEADVSDKPELTRMFPPIPASVEAQLTRVYRDRLESLLAVDDLIGAVVRALRRQHVLRRTVILFTSDNGWLQGEHRWRAGKVVPYEPSIRVPLIVRGPGIPRGVTRSQLVANVDLAPTILRWAHAKPGRPQDGLPLQPLLGPTPPPWQRAILLEGWFNAFGEYPGTPRIVFKGVRTDRYMYARYENGEEELYDLQTDPYELESRQGDPQFVGVRAGLSRLLDQLQSCAGPSCRLP